MAENNIDIDLINNRFELSEWVFNSVKTKLDEQIAIYWKSFDDREIKIKQMMDQVKYQVSDLNEAIKAINQEKHAIEQSTSALNDRTNNLQNIYDKMLVIEKKLELFGRIGDVFKPEPEPEYEPDDPLSSASIDILNLPTRAHNCLKSAGINCVRDLVETRQRTLMAIPNLGRWSLIEIKNSLREYGLSLKQY